MAFAFSDSSAKLPPITKDSHTSASRDSGVESVSPPMPGLHREKHGLVRLPPIIRLDSATSTRRPTPFASQRYENPGPAEDDRSSVERTEPSMVGISSRFSPSVEEDGTGNARRENGFHSKLNDVDRVPDVKMPSSEEKHDLKRKSVAKRRVVENNTRLLSSDFRPQSRRPSLTSFQERSQNCSTKPRRGSKFGGQSNKLQRTRRLAKSSGERPEDNNNYSSFDLKPTQGHGETRRPSVYDMNATLHFKSDIEEHVHSVQKPTKQNASKIEGTAKQRTKKRKEELACKKTHSMPPSPVCDEIPKTSGFHGRKSLTEIEGLLSLNTRRPSIEPPKSQNLVTEGSTGLAVEGKSCTRSERRLSRGSTSMKSHLAPPSQTAIKRNSLYDLQQILSILNQEGSGKSSAASSPHNLTPTPGDHNNRASSVYDIREFLSLAVAEASQKGDTNFERQGLKEVQSGQPQVLENSTSPVPPTGNRKASAYDLLEFLTLNLSAKSKSQSSSGASTPPKISFNPGQQDSESSKLDTPGNATSRRSSTYDLLEFLSLKAAASRPHTPFQEKQKSSENSFVETKSEDLHPGNREQRSISVYDLSEFLAMQTAAQSSAEQHPVVQQQFNNKSEQNLKPTDITDPASLKSTEGKRGSIYDLQEFLSVLHQEAQAEGPLERPTNSSSTEKTAESTHDPQEYLSMFQEGVEAERHENRQVSVYDLREFLARKPSSISESGVSIYVTEETTADKDVVFLPVPSQESADTIQRKRSSIYDLREFLSILNNEDSPLRRRQSSVSSANGNAEHRPSISSRQDSGGSNFLCVNSNSRPSLSDASSRPKLEAHRDSGGNRSLYDLHEFLSLLNSDDTPLRRRLSSMSERGDARSPSSLTRHDSNGDKSSMYDLDECLTVLNDLAHKEHQRNAEEEASEELTDKICIQVPQMLPKAGEKSNSERFTMKKRLTALKSVPQDTGKMKASERSTRLSL